jgi:tetratricopeptide (TPR) repeat protein
MRIWTVAGSFLCAACLTYAGGCGAANRAVAAADQVEYEPIRIDATQNPAFSAEARFVAGQIAQSKNRFEPAAHCFQDALSLNPNFAPAAYHLGVVNTQMKRYSQAIDAFWDYVKLTDESAAAYGNLGYCYELAGMRHEAEAAYRRGLSRDVADESCRVNYGLMLARQGRQEEALAQLTVILEPAQAHYNIASIYELQGHKDQARNEFSKALTLDPQMSAAETRLSTIDDPNIGGVAATTSVPQVAQIR